MEDQVRTAKNLAKLGFTALKFDPYSSEEGGEKLESTLTRHAFPDAVEKVRAVREAVGNGVDLMIDLHGRTTPIEAIKFAHAVEQWNPLFIEEPVPPENVDALATIQNSVRVPIATGERIFTKFGFREILEKRAAALCNLIFVTAVEYLKQKR